MHKIGIPRAGGKQMKDFSFWMEYDGAAEVKNYGL
jgi:hypothetical protein